jgi:hypothetical protein
MTVKHTIILIACACLSQLLYSQPIENIDFDPVPRTKNEPNKKTKKKTPLPAEKEKKEKESKKGVSEPKKEQPLPKNTKNKSTAASTATDADKNTEPTDTAPKKKKAGGGGNGGAPTGSINFGFKTVTIDGQTWTLLNLFPEIGIGPFAAAFDIQLYLDAKGTPDLSRGWNFSTFANGVDSILTKIYYLRWSTRDAVVNGKAPFYLKVGALDSVTIGYGIIMDRFTNTLNYPAVKEVGVDTAIGNLGPMRFGLRTMVNNFSDIAQGGPITGGRLFFYPFGPFQIGISGVADLNQYSQLTDSDGDGYPDAIDKAPDDANVFNKDDFNMAGKHDVFSVVGADVGVTLFTILSLYSQFATNYDPVEYNDTVKNAGWGSASGVGLSIAWLDAKLEYRVAQDRFLFGFFDFAYANNRVKLISNDQAVTKENTISDGFKNGLYGRLTFKINDVVDIVMGYHHLNISGSSDGINYDAGYEGRLKAGKRLMKVAPMIGGMEAFILRKQISDYSTFFEAHPELVWGVSTTLTPTKGFGFQVRYQIGYQYNENGDLTEDRQINIGATSLF